MHYPYTESWSDAVVAAQSSLAIVATAMIVARPIRPKISSVLFLGAVWLTAFLPIEPKLLAKFGVVVAEGHVVRLLRIATTVVTVAFFVAKPRWVAVIAPLGQGALWWLCSYLIDSDLELTAVHLGWFGALYGFYDRFARRVEVRHRAGWRAPPRTSWFERAWEREERSRTEPPRRSYPWHDAGLFAIAMTLGALVSSGVLHRFCNSGDEWANTYQADVFAHFKAYGTPPPCPGAFQNYWVFYYMGRAFSQYTPGWPLVMAPFQRVNVPWMAAPFVSGVLAVGVAALSRRVARGTDGVSERGVAAAGIAGALAVTFCASQALMSGSRYPHTLVCASFAWSAELLSRITHDRPARGAQWRYGLALGAVLALLLGTRPTDGATLGVGFFSYFCYSLVRLRIRWRAVLATSLGFGLVAGLVLVILHAQTGAWFKTGYELAPEFWPWLDFKLSAPPPELVKRAVPIGAMIYCYFPCVPAIGLFGLFAARRAGHVTFMLTLGALLLTAFYAFVEYGRMEDVGYGPRYDLPTIVCFGVGVGAALGPLLVVGSQRFASRSAFAVGGPPAVAIAGLAIAVVRIAWALYPVAWEETYSRSATLRAVAAAEPPHSVIMVRGGDVAFDPLDLTQNFENLESADAIIAADRSFIDMLCLRSHFKSRKFYRAVGMRDVTLTPM